MQADAARDLARAWRPARAQQRGRAPPSRRPRGRHPLAPWARPVLLLGLLAALPVPAGAGNSEKKRRGARARRRTCLRKRSSRLHKRVETRTTTPISVRERVSRRVSALNRLRAVPFGSTLGRLPRRRARAARQRDVRRPAVCEMVQKLGGVPSDPGVHARRGRGRVPARVRAVGRAQRLRPGATRREGNRSAAAARRRGRTSSPPPAERQRGPRNGAGQGLFVKP